MEAAISAAQWVVSKALGPITDGVLDAWAASSKLGLNIHALKVELLGAQAILNRAGDRDIRNPALVQLLLELQHLAYAADDVLDELDYFRIQDELDGTHETIDDADEKRGFVFHFGHTMRSVAGKFTWTSSASGSRVNDPAIDVEVTDAEQGRCRSAGAVAPSLGKRLRSFFLPYVQSDAGAGTPANEPCFVSAASSSIAQQGERAVLSPKLKFDRVEVSKKMTDIVDKLRPLCATVAAILPLEPLGKTQGTDLERRPKTDPAIIEPELFGRQIQKRTIADEIINGKYCANDITVLPIVGPGGIGKTTFTQHIYEQVKSHFQVTVWLCVSQNFNANKLLEEIVKQIMPNYNNQKGNYNCLEQIEKTIQSKQFLLVLDDIWTYHEDEWKKLLAPFKRVGTRGNMVIVTTRIPKVAKMIDFSDYSIKLECLGYEDSMQLFQASVFRDKKTWEDYPAGLQQVGINIVKRLKGSPLAIKTVGRLLKNKLTLDQWTRVFESKEWEFQTNDDDIMPVLKLSYNYLPFHLQQCFCSCALFPEDYKFGKQELINLWIGLGLLGTGHQNKITEDIGLDYLDKLVDNGFFEQVGKEDDSPYGIHDLLYELATSVSSYESIRIDSSGVSSVKIPTSIRHMSIIIDNTHVKDTKTFERHKKDISALGKKLKSVNLRTIMLFGEHHGSFCKVFADILRDARSLRVIFLSEASYDVDDMFHNFSKLVHLRYLRIKGSIISRVTLPSNLSRCYHLMVLDVQDYYHDITDGEFGFACNMGNLLKLRHFLVPYSSIHSRIPEVGKLKCLKELQRFVVKKEMKGFELMQIGKLLELQGSLHIFNLERIEEVKEADEVKLAHMNRLDGLKLDWDKYRRNKDPIQEGKILESLKPHSNLRELSITGHGGDTSPNWLGAEIQNLQTLCLKDVRWKTLPLPGKLCMNENEDHHGSVTGQGFYNLKKLELIEISTLKKWQGYGSSNFLPHLENLNISGCPELIEFPLSYSISGQSEQRMTCFPKLKTIHISNCPKLLPLFPPIPWSSCLLSVGIRDVPSVFEQLYYGEDSGSKLTSLSVTGKNDQEAAFWNVLDFNNLIGLQELVITRCPPVPVDHLKMLTCLKTLRITCSSNVYLPVDIDRNVQYELPVENFSAYSDINSRGPSGKKLTHLLSHFPKLSTLSIMGCENVTGLGVTDQQRVATCASPPSASANRAADIPTRRQQKQTGADEEAAAAPGDEGLLLLPSQIQELDISFCRELRFCSNSIDCSGAAAAERVGLEGLLSLLSLRWLAINHCPKLFCSSLHSPFPTSLQKLSLWDVVGTETIPTLPNITELNITDCNDLRGGETLWALLAQGHLTNLRVQKTPNFFIGSEPFPVDEQVIRRFSKLQELTTDDFAGVLSAPICRTLSSSLIKLDFIWNEEVECLTNEQEEALQILTSIQELRFQFCGKFRSLPAGLSRLPSLTTLWIRYCPEIRSLEGLPDSLQKLMVHSLPAIMSLGVLPDSLQELDIDGCLAIYSLDSLPSSLQELRIGNCPSIRLLPKDGIPCTLRQIDVRCSINEELNKQCDKLKGTIPIIIN